MTPGQCSDEFREQAAFIEYCRWKEAESEDYSMVFAYPAAGRRSFWEQGKRKMEGLRAGLPDVFILVPRGTYHGLFFEFKSEKGKLSKEQKVWLKRLRERGYLAGVVYKSETAIEVLDKYLNQKLA